MNSVHASRFPRFRVLISAKRSEKACPCPVMEEIKTSLRKENLADLAKGLAEKHKEMLKLIAPT